MNILYYFFSFPKKEDIFKQWKKIVPTKNYITKHSRICSKHFQNFCYEHVGKKRVLKYDMQYLQYLIII